MVTGNFDNWSKRDGVLTKDADSDAFETELRLDSRQKLIFKFVINDTDWVTHEDYKLEHDEQGNPNNVVFAEELVAIEEFQKDPSPVVPSVQEPVIPYGVSTSKDAEVEPELPATPVKLVLETRSEGEKLTQVLTSESSYAAVSIPGFSDYENIAIPDETEGLLGDPARNRTAPEDDTPTNSLYNSAVLAPTPGKQQPTQDSEVTTLGPNSRNSSFTGKPLQPEGDAVSKSPLVKVPGSFPSPMKETLPEKRASRRDGLITRLKGLFRP